MNQAYDVRKARSSTACRAIFGEPVQLLRSCCRLSFIFFNLGEESACNLFKFLRKLVLTVNVYKRFFPISPGAKKVLSEQYNLPVLVVIPWQHSLPLQITN